MSRLTKVLMLCVDAGDTELIRRWSEAGELPTFRSLLATGCSMPVENPAGLYGGALWPSFYGGVSPARHGRYSPEQLAKGTYRVELFPDEDAKAMPFWNAIAEAGLRVAVIDVPKAPLSMHENVTQVSNWGTADKDPACLRSRPDLLAMDLASAPLSCARSGVHSDSAHEFPLAIDGTSAPVKRYWRPNAGRSVASRFLSRIMLSPSLRSVRIERKLG